MSLFEELKRRNVFRVGAAYVVIGWIIAQVAEFAFENFGAPEWVLKSVVVMLLLGLPIALLFAWAFEITPEGVKREKDVDRSDSVAHGTGKKLNAVIIATLVVALAYFVWEREADTPTEPADVIATNTAAAASTPPAKAPGAITKKSIAVLPFVNLSSDQEQEWFSDGLTEEILNALARTPDLLVTARTSSFKYKNSDEDVPTIAKALGVAHILEGSVRRDEDRLRVSVQLIRASDGFNLWSQNYDRKPEDVISVQEEVAVEIATAMETALDPAALARMVSSGTTSVAAYNNYLQGLASGVSSISTGNAYTWASARDAYERAIELDPEFALAHWELARFWGVQQQTTNIVSGTVEMPLEQSKAEFINAIENAIRYAGDPTDRRRFEVLRAEKTLQIARALKLNEDYMQQRPNDNDARNRHLRLLTMQMPAPVVRAALQDLMDESFFDPLTMTNSITYSMLTNDPEFIRDNVNYSLSRQTENIFATYQAHRALLWAGDIDQASGLLRDIQTSELPEQNRLMVMLRQACAEQRDEQAQPIYRRLIAENTDSPSTLWIVHRVMGEDEKAREIIADLDASGDMATLVNLLTYAYFDANELPQLSALLAAQGILPRAPLDIPYRCNREV